jgi:ribonuclease G
LDDGVVSEYHVERPSRPSLVGNVYKGRVENVLSGMDAAFVDIGVGRNGYLAVSDVSDADASPRGSRNIGSLLKAGREVLVQVTRDGAGTKGPRLATQIGIAGRYAVFIPGSRACGASKRLDAAERTRLQAICRSIKPEGAGIIARTAAEGAEADQVERDLRFLQRVWGGVEQRARDASAPALVYRESELSIRAIRDVAGAEFEAIIVDDENLQRRLRNYLRAVAPGQEDRVTLHRAEKPLFAAHGVDDEIRKAMKRRVELPSGGYLIVDYTEAMTVIDVNTGRFVGSRRLEDTTLRTNLEACREVVRQLRLRDIGGIVVIDFIDMTVASNRQQVLESLQSELDRDRTKTYVVQISPLGLVEMTRRNASRGLIDVMTSQCPLCHGEGRVLSDESALIAVERRLTDMSGASGTPGLRIEVHPRIMGLLESGHPTRLEQLEHMIGHFIILQAADQDVPVDHAAVVPD